MERLKEELGLNNELREDNSDILISSLVEKVFLRAEIIQKENNLKNICSGVVLAALLEVINEKPENPESEEEIRPVKELIGYMPESAMLTRLIIRK